LLQILNFFFNIFHMLYNKIILILLQLFFKETRLTSTQ